jgi:predicted ATP-grasp superfamily ATP-dependent carboligase
MKRRVLITGARAPVAIDLARSFAAAEYEVHLADSVVPWAAKWSRVGRGHVHRLPAARWAFDDYGSALAALVNQLDPELLVPTCEEVFYVAAAARRHGFANRTFAPDLPTLRTLHSKIRFAEFAHSIGLPAPRTWAVGNPRDVSSLPLCSKQLVFKPEYSRFGTATLLRPDSKRLARLNFEGQLWAAQEFVEGTEVCLWSAAVRGRVVASAAYRPAWRFGHAASYAFERIQNPAVEDVARKVAEATGMTGHLSFDIIVTPQGDAVPIECNPRAVSGVHLFDGCAELAQAMMGNVPPLQPQSAFRYLAPAMLVLGAPKALATGRWRVFAADWRRGADVLGRPGDRLPALGALMDAGRFALAGLMRRRSASGQSTDDIEWNGEVLP